MDLRAARRSKGKSFVMESVPPPDPEALFTDYVKAIVNLEKLSKQIGGQQDTKSLRERLAKEKDAINQLGKRMSEELSNPQNSKDQVSILF